MRIIAGMLLAVTLSLPGALLAQAVPGTEGVLTWKAETYTPYGYRGKALPTQGSFISAAFELVENGKLADLSKRELRWFVNDALLRSGRGLKQVRFEVASGVDSSQFVRVQVTDGRNILFEKSAEIPVVRPRISVLPLPLGTSIGRGTHEFRAVPFFFNAKSIDEIFFSWTVNGATASAEGVDEPFKLSLPVSGDIEAGTPLILSVFAARKSDQTEAASKEFRFTVR